MARYFPHFPAALVCVVLWHGGNGAFAQSKSDVIPGGPSKSNSRILDVFKPVVAKAAESTVAVLVGGKQVALGTVVNADGFIITKDSELQSEDIVVKFKDGKQLAARKISSNNDWDLAMLKVDATDLQPVGWAESKVAPVGNWVATPAPTDKPIAVGVVGVAARKMPPGSKRPQPKNINNSGYLGIQMEDTEDGTGVKITIVTAKSPAEKAGLKVDDVVLAIDGAETLDLEALRTTIGLHKPGDTVTIRLRRGAKEEEIKATLAKRPAELNNRGDLQNAMGTDRSERRTGFPVTLQHDTDLKNTQCGGPLVDLDGRVIGINIARGGRTDTYAIPAEAIKPLLADLMVAKVSTPSLAVKAMLQEVKRIEAAIKSANVAKSAVQTKLDEAKSAVAKKQAEIKDLEDAKAAEDKKLAEYKAALEKIQAQLKQENEKK